MAVDSNKTFTKMSRTKNGKSPSFYSPLSSRDTVVEEIRHGDFDSGG